MFFLILHVWMISFVALLLNSTISLVQCIHNSQWAEISDEEFVELEEKLESRKRLRHFDNPKYEE